MRTPVRTRPPSERIRDFFEVSLGFSEEEARREAARCLQCVNAPCARHCPVGIDIPAFIALLKAGKQREALAKIKERNNLPAVCGRVCPQEDQCEGACVLQGKKIPINIGALERYASEAVSESKREEGRKKKEEKTVEASVIPRPSSLGPPIAVAGSGPAGLTCAADLAKLGYAVTLFESLHVPGGVMVYGIPEFRLPKTIVGNEVTYIESLGVELKTDTLIGNTRTIAELFRDGFKAVFIATGAGLPQFLGIGGENLNNVYSANEFLTRVNLMKAYAFPSYATPVTVGARAAVIGGGNVALDAARCARRLGAATEIIYRRSEAEMPGRAEELEHAKEEGIAIRILSQPVRIIDDGRGFAAGIECIKMTLGDPDDSGRRRPVPVPDSAFVVAADTVIIAIGQNPNPLLPKATPGLDVNTNGTIKVNDRFMTSLPGVFAGGDIITGADTVIAAMGAGKKAALAIDAFVKNLQYLH